MCMLLHHHDLRIILGIATIARDYTWVEMPVADVVDEIIIASQKFELHYLCTHTIHIVVSSYVCRMMHMYCVASSIDL